MKLWLIRPVDGLDQWDNPWEPWYDKAFGFIVRAETENDAREFAHENAGEENSGAFLSVPPWKDKKYSTCTELLPEGESGILMQDYAKA